MSEWKPIETAPKDETRIILRRPPNYGERYAICYYSKFLSGWTPIQSNSTFYGATKWTEIPE